MSVRKIIRNPLIIVMDRATELLRLKMEMVFHDYPESEASKKFSELVEPKETEGEDHAKKFTETPGNLKDKCAAIGIHNKQQYDNAVKRWTDKHESLSKLLEECKSVFEMRGGERKVVKPLLPKYRL